jgi:hypothetical protein
VPEHDLGEVDALLPQDVDHRPSGLLTGRGVHGQRRAGLAVGCGLGPQDALDPGAHLGVLDRALQEGGPHPGAGDADRQVADEVVDHRLRPVEGGARAAQRVGERQVAVGVDAGRDDDVQVDLTGDLLHPGDVPAEADDRRVDDGGDALGPQRGQLLDRVGDPAPLVPPAALAVVLHVLGGQHEDVLVHQGDAEVVDVDVPEHGGDLRHGHLLELAGA